MSTTEPAVERAFRYAVAPLTGVKFRDEGETGSQEWTIEGYAAVFDQRTTLFDGSFYRVTEEIAPGAFRGALARLELPDDDPDQGLVHLNYVHDTQASIAATDAPGMRGRLELQEDEHGLRFWARVAKDDLDVQRIMPKMRDGIVRQASFAFTIADEDPPVATDLGDGKVGEHFRINEIGELFDVCVCPRGAYKQTVSQLRSYAAAIGRSPEREGRREGVAPADPVGASGVAQDDPAGTDTRQLEAKRLEMRRRFLIATRRVSS